MNRKAFIAVIVVAAVIAIGSVWALVLDDSSQLPTSEAPTTETLPNDATPAAATITYTDTGFTPGTITVNKGDTVTVTNTSSSSVKFSSDDHPTHLLNPEVNQETLNPSKSQTFTVSQVGTFGYHNHLNDSQGGQIIVTDMQP
ncbi:cupredoxin domain-containing protein [Pedobacter sp.]|nr:cupredoxin domain-containing protein [Candidatus Saccharibacteria bacterium]